MLSTFPARSRRFVALVLLAGFLASCNGGDVSGTSDAPAGRTSATIRWEAPETRADGSSLGDDDLAGYKVCYADDSGEIYRVVDVDKMTTSFTVTALPPGRYYFTVTAYDSSSHESEPSNSLTVTFP